MPLLSSFGGASVRSLGRGIEQVAPVFPAGTIVLYNRADISALTAPSGWSFYAGFNGRYILGTSTNASIDTFGSGAGSATLTLSTSATGEHYGPQNVYFPSSYSSSLNSTRFNALGGNHSHTGSSTGDLSALTPDTVNSPVLTTTTNQSMLPAYAVVFRTSVPSGSFDHYRPAANGWFSGSSVTQWVDKSGDGSVVGGTAVGGSHSHGQFQTTWTWYSGSTPGHQASGGHNHPFTASLRATLKSKQLKPWYSTVARPLEYGMIVMYKGSLTQLPAGWRVCNGTLGTPDMSDFFLGYTSAEVHGQTISSSNTVSLSATTAATLGSVTWEHSHITPLNVAYTSNYTGVHGTYDPGAHTHTATVANVSNITGYTPPWRKVAFIQYKGI